MSAASNSECSGGDTGSSFLCCDAHRKSMHWCCHGKNVITFLCQWISRSVKDEVKALLSLSWPVMLTIFFQFFLTEVNILFCGHIGKLELDAAGLAISFTNVTGFSVGLGMASACDTLISQACGAKNFYKVGIIIQKGILILSLVMFPIWAIWLNAAPILLALQQDSEVVKQAAVVCKILIIGLPGTFLYTILRKYLQNQGIVRHVAVVGFIVILVSTLTHFVTVVVLDLGLSGAAGSLVFSQLLQPVICLAMIRYKRLSTKTWNGWSWDSIVDWWLFLRLALPSAAMVCIEWWSFEIVALVAGMISAVDLAASLIIFQVVTTLLMFPIGITLSAAVRVGTFLGANQPAKAKRAAWVAICLISMFTVFTSMLLLSLRCYVSYIFTSDKDVVTLVAKTVPIIAPLLIVDGLQASVNGVYRGAGRQKVGAVVNLISCYFVGLPIGISLALVGKMGVMGLWIGVFCGLLVMAVGGLFLVLRLDWRNEAMKAQKRIGVISLSLENLSENKCEQSNTCLQVEEVDEETEFAFENSCNDTVALVVDDSSSTNQECRNEITIEDASECENQNLKFEVELGSTMSLSQKRTALYQKLSLFLFGAVIVIGAGITSNFVSYQDSHLCDSNMNISSFCTCIRLSNGTQLSSVPTVPVSFTSKLGLLLMTSLQCSSTTLPASSKTIPSVSDTIHPRPSQVLKLHSSSYVTSFYSTSTLISR